MDLDQFNSASDEQMDMLMMMQMDKLSELCGGTEFSFMGTFTENGGSTSSGKGNPNIMQQMFENSNSPSSFTLDPHSTISFTNPEEEQYTFSSQTQKKNSSMAAMREMIFRIAAMQPIHIDPESVKPPKRRNVKISKDPQSVAARHRRERISERIRILQRLVPGGTKMDTASMLDEAIHYVKFLKTQVQSLERASVINRPQAVVAGMGFPVAMGNGSYPPMSKPYHHQYQSVPQNHHVQPYNN